jgi:hypothetical protein
MDCRKLSSARINHCRREASERTRRLFSSEVDWRDVRGKTARLQNRSTVIYGPLLPILNRISALRSIFKHLA